MCVPCVALFHTVEMILAFKETFRRMSFRIRNEPGQITVCPCLESDGSEAAVLLYP